MGLHLDLLHWKEIKYVNMILLVNTFTLLTHLRKKVWSFSSYIIFKWGRTQIRSIALCLKWMGKVFTSRSQGGIQIVVKACGAAGLAEGYGSQVRETPKQTQTHTSDRKHWAKQKHEDLKDEGSEALRTWAERQECVCM